MGCGQSKINLYPRRNKNGSKGNSAKKTGVAEKETDEEEGSSATGTAPADDTEDEPECIKHILPLSHPPPITVSASQRDFFKMLDEKIEKGKDYDSSSETELQLENERRRKLIQEWRSASQSTKSSQSQPSPPTPARRKVLRPIPQPPDRQNSPGAVRRCHRQSHIPEGTSPPPRRSHSAQSHHATDQQIVNGENWNDPTKSPVKRPQSAGSNWKNNPKVAPYVQKPKKCEISEHQKKNQKNDYVSSSQDISQITFNPTFQSHSPAHSVKNQQPYIAQIISYPISQQVTPPSTPKYIAPPEEYQDPENNIVESSTLSPTPSTTQTNVQSHIYFIHGNTSTTVSQDLAQQRQQTAFHLQQYVAMKQAQQQMFSYMQRGPHTVFPNSEYSEAPNHQQMYETEYQVRYTHPVLRPHSAPTVGIVRPIPVAPGFTPMTDGSHMVQVPMWSHIPPVPPTLGPWVSGPLAPEMQYYPQSQFTPMYRPNSAGSAGTLTRYPKRDTGNSEVKNMCQSVNLVRQKPLGQIVSLPSQELSVCNNSTSDNTSPVSVSTDSGVSSGNNVSSGKNTANSTPTGGMNDTNNANDCKNTKKNKNAPYKVRSLKSSKSVDS